MYEIQSEGEMTTKTKILQKIRDDIKTAEAYQSSNPYWESIKTYLAYLREREHVLANEIQIDNFKAEMRRAV